MSKTETHIIRNTDANITITLNTYVFEHTHRLNDKLFQTEIQ